MDIEIRPWNLQPHVLFCTQQLVANMYTCSYQSDLILVVISDQHDFNVISRVV